jgi:uncharacterized membrane protein
LETLNHTFSWVCGQNPDHTWIPGGLPLPCCQRCTGLYVGAAVAVLLHLALKPLPTARFLQIHGLFLLLMVPFGFHWLPQGELLRAGTGVLFGFGVVTFLSLKLSARTTTARLRSSDTTFCLTPALSPRRGGIVSGAGECSPTRAFSKRGDSCSLSLGERVRVRASFISNFIDAVDADSATASLATVLYWLGLALTLLAVPALGLGGGHAAAHTLLGLAAFGALALAALALANVVQGGALVCSRLWTFGSRKAPKAFGALRDSAREMCERARSRP